MTNKHGRITIAQLADGIGVSVHTLRRWYRDNLLNGFTRTTTGRREWHPDDVPKIIVEIAKMISARPYEKRTHHEIATPMLERWYGANTAPPSTLPDDPPDEADEGNAIELPPTGPISL